MSNKLEMYTIKSGDCLNVIVDKFKNGDLFAGIYYEVDQELTTDQVFALTRQQSDSKKIKQQHPIYPGEHVYLPYISREINLILPHGIDVHACFFTGDTVKVKMPAFRLLIDAHMHIQSSQTTPLTLQWAKIYMEAKLDEKSKSRRYMTDFLAGRIWWAAGDVRKSSGDLGNIVQFSSDIVAKLFMGTATRDDFKAKLFWLFWDDISEFNREQAEEEGHLEDLTRSKERELQDFYKSSAYYYKDCQVFQTNLVMPMDLSFAHFWGLHSNPIYLPVPGGTTFYYIDDFSKINIWIKKAELKNCWAPLVKDKIPHLSYKYDLVKDLNNFIDYFINKYSSQDKKDQDIFNMSFDYKRIADFINKNKPTKPGWGSSDQDKEQYEKKMVHFRNTLNPFLENIRNKYKTLVDKEYKHFLAEMPGEDTEMFEDHWEQTALTEASALRYPLQLIPFYHYDPRRSYSQDNMQESIINNLHEKHSFVFLEQISTKLTDSKRSHLLSVETFESRLRNTAYLNNLDQYFKDILFNGVYVTDPYTLRKVLLYKPFMEKHNEVLNFLYPNGPFLGVKVYPALGYPADLYKSAYKSYYRITDRYTNWDELFTYCEDNGIPVTTHCSPLGMTIADSFNYILHSRAGHTNRNPRECALYLDHITGNPERWEPVLNDHKKLKLNLAHFGSMDKWVNPIDEPVDAYDWRKKISDIIKNPEYKNVYTDISCYTMEYGKIKATIDKDDMENDILPNCTGEEKEIMNKAYTFKEGWFPTYKLKDQLTFEHLSMLRCIFRRLDLIDDSIETIGENLKNAIQKNDLLRWRILMGSDWYLAEMGHMGLGGYFLRMFEMLKYITKGLGDNWDAWHQFAVINPLNFLGLLETGGDGKLIEDEFNSKKIYKLNIERLEKMIENLEKKSNNSDWKDLADIIKKDIDKFNLNTIPRLKQLKATRIYTAEEIKKDGNLILTYTYKEQNNEI